MDELVQNDSDEESGLSNYDIEEEANVSWPENGV
jgi:hypothetical protein